jgi:hypothetical protein
MAMDDESARRARAEALRKRIDGVTRGTPAPPPLPDSETPAEFVNRRMRELDKTPKKPD